MTPLDLEVYYGERLAVLGSHGSGKSHLLRLLAGEAVFGADGRVYEAPEPWWDEERVVRAR